MFKILKYAKKYWLYMVFVIVFMLVQAVGELLLPNYTSSIVNNGIQFGGIESAVPQYIDENTFNELEIFMTDEEKELFEKSFTLSDGKALSISADNVYTAVFDSKNKETVNKLEALLSETEAVCSTVKATMSDDDITNMTAEEAQETRIKTQQVLAAQSESNVKNTAMMFVKNMYTNMGVDVNAMQLEYLRKKGVTMALMAFFAMAAAAAAGFFAAKIAACTSRDLRNKLFEKVLGFSNAEMNNFSTASLITRCTNDIQQIQMVTVMMFRIVIFAPLMGVGGVIMALKTNMGLSWVIALSVIVLMGLVAVLMSLAMPKFKIMQSLVDKLNLVAREILTGVSVIRAFSREKFEEKRFDDENKNLMQTQLFTNRVMTFMMPSMLLIMNATSVLIVYLGAQGANNGTIMVGDMMAFISYATQIIFSFLMITMISIMLPRAAVAADRVDQVLSIKNEIVNPEKPIEPEKITGKIEFKNVDFSYGLSEEKTLENISFTALPGQTTAIIGSTGCGKTSLVSLIPRLYDVTGGEVLLDGVDVRKMDLRTLRAHIGFVPQKGILFSGTIKSNILFGCEEDESVMYEAAQTAQAEDFIEEKDKKYDSRISQGGGNVSGGQKQRLAIARAIAKRPEVYVFDDSFSALDYKTDKMLRAALNEKVGNATVIIVAQRISTILHAEKIIVLDEGKIAGIGTHEELLKNNEIYRQIALSQLSEKELGEKIG